MPIQPFRVIANPDETTQKIVRKKPAEGAVDTGPFSVGQGGGDTDYICGACGNVLLSQITPGSVRSVLFECPGCGKYNGI